MFHPVSKAQDKLALILKELYPSYQITEEYVLKGKLRLDLFIKDLGLAFEVQGRQHYQYIPHFHGDTDGFREAQQRDREKKETCEEQGICLIYFKDNEEITRESVSQRISESVSRHDFSSYDAKYRNKLKRQDRKARNEYKPKFKVQRKTQKVRPVWTKQKKEITQAQKDYQKQQRRRAKEWMKQKQQKQLKLKK